MIFTCTRCRTVFRVFGDPLVVAYLVGKDSEFWPDRYRCPSCRSSLLPSEEKDVMPELLASPKIVHLEAEEAYAALMGIGLPEERKATLEAVRSVSVGHKVEAMGLEPVPNIDRTSVTWIRFDNGHTLYFAGGGAGAVIYRVKKPTSYVEQLDREG